MDETRKPAAKDTEEVVSENRREIFSSLGLLALGGGAAALLGCEGEGTAGNPPDVIESVSQALETDVGTIADLRALAAPTSGNPARLILGYGAAADGGGGIFIWHASELGPQLGMSPTGDDGGTIIKPNSLTASQPGRWKRLYSGPLSVKWFGAKGDGVNNDGALIRNALVAAGDGVDNARSRDVYMPAGDYKCSDDLVIDRNVHFFGASGTGRNAKTRLLFVDGKKLWIKGATGNQIGQSCVIEHFNVQSLSEGQSGRVADVPGIYCETGAVIRHVSVFGFNGHGLHIDGSTAARNANFWRASNCWFENNEQWGMFVGGINSNAGMADHVHLVSNGFGTTGGGLRESSFLGNTYVNLTVEGLLYPVDMVHPRPRSIHVDGNVNKCSFLGIYAESDHAAALFDSTGTVVFGGVWGTPIDPASTALILVNRSNLNFPFAVQKGTKSLGFGTSGTSVMHLQDASENDDIHLEFGSNANGWWEWIRAGQAMMAMSGNLADLGGGKIWFPQGIFLGATANRKLQTYGAAAPTSGTFRQGDIVWNAQPTAGGNAGWICVAAGTPGTWKTFGSIAV